jgi:hypothetical protein
LFLVEEGEPVHVIERDKGWLHVRSPSPFSFVFQGWIPADSVVGPGEPPAIFGTRLSPRAPSHRVTQEVPLLHPDTREPTQLRVAKGLPVHRVLELGDYSVIAIPGLIRRGETAFVVHSSALVEDPRPVAEADIPL